MAKRIDPAAVEAIVGTLYPPPFDRPCRARERRKLGDAAGLTQYGVNLLRLPPGRESRLRIAVGERRELARLVQVHLEYRLEAKLRAPFVIGRLREPQPKAQRAW